MNYTRRNLHKIRHRITGCRCSLAVSYTQTATYWSARVGHAGSRGSVPQGTSTADRNTSTSEIT